MDLDEHEVCKVGYYSSSQEEEKVTEDEHYCLKFRNS